MITWYKPAGLHVFPPHGDPSGDCVLTRLLAAQPWRDRLAWPEGFEGGVVHRLDGPTSGALLVADDPAELLVMRRWFTQGVVSKTYRFEAARDVPWSQGRCDREIAHDRRHNGRMVVRRGEQTPHRGRWFAAETSFRRVRGSIWEAVITTGVTHQIRVHGAFVGLPLAGDRRYGGGDPLDPTVQFRLHCVGMATASKHLTDSLPLPDWAR